MIIGYSKGLMDTLLGKKADLVNGDVPDAQLPDRLQDVALRAAYVPLWTSVETVGTGAFRLAPDGTIIQRNTDGITRSTYDATEAALWTAHGGGSSSGAYVPLGQGAPRLASWFRKLKSDPANAVLALSGDSTSDGGAGPTSPAYARLGISLQGTTIPGFTHTAPGEGLAGMTVDAAHIIDGGNNGMRLSVYLSDYDSNVTTAKSLRWLIAQAPNLIMLSWGINDIRLGLTTQAQLVTLLTRLVGIIETALPNTDIVLRIPATLGSDDYNGNHSVTDSSGTINPAGLAQTYSNQLRAAYYTLQDTRPNLVLFDMPATVFGLVSQPRAVNGMMTDQLHPNSTGQYAWVDYLVQNIIGYYPAKLIQPSVTIGPLANSPYAPWTVNPAVLDDTTRFVQVAAGQFIGQGSGYLDFTYSPAANITNWDIIKLPDGQVYQLPASSVTVSQNTTTCRILNSGLPTSASIRGNVRIYRQVTTGDSAVNTVLADTSWRFRRLGRVTAGSATTLTVRAVSNSAGRATQPASEWAPIMAAGDKVYVEGLGTTPVTLTAGQFSASSTDLALTGLSGTDYTTYVGRLVLLVGAHTDQVAGPQGPTGPAGGFGAPLISGFYSNPALFGATSGFAGTLNSASAVPFVPANSGSIDRLLMEIITAVAGSTVALALYGDSSTTPGRPGALLGDFGSIDGSATGVKETATIATPVAVTAGLRYWLAASPQGSASANARAFASTGGATPFIVSTAASLGFASAYALGVSGAWPPAWSGSQIGTWCPWIRARAV